MAETTILPSLLSLQLKDMGTKTEGSSNPSISLSTGQNPVITQLLLSMLMSMIERKKLNEKEKIDVFTDSDKLGQFLTDKEKIDFLLRSQSNPNLMQISPTLDRSKLILNAAEGSEYPFSLNSLGKIQSGIEHQNYLGKRILLLNQPTLDLAIKNSLAVPDIEVFARSLLLNPRFYSTMHNILMSYILKGVPPLEALSALLSKKFPSIPLQLPMWLFPPLSLWSLPQFPIQTRPPFLMRHPPPFLMRPPQFPIGPFPYLMRPPPPFLMRPPQFPMRPPPFPMRPPPFPITPSPFPMRPPQFPMGPPQFPMRPPQFPMGPPQFPMRPPQFPMGPPQFPMGPPQFPIRPPQFPMGPPPFPIRPPQFPMGPPPFPIRPPQFPMGPPFRIEPPSQFPMSSNLQYLSTSGMTPIPSLQAIGSIDILIYLSSFRKFSSTFTKNKTRV